MLIKVALKREFTVDSFFGIGKLLVASNHTNPKYKLSTWHGWGYPFPYDWNPYKREGDCYFIHTRAYVTPQEAEMRFLSHLSIISLLSLRDALAFPSYGTLAGLSRSELDAILPTLKRGVLESPPGPLNDTSAKLVNDKEHPWKPAGKTDIRGPCPGLNTLASHGVG